MFTLSKLVFTSLVILAGQAHANPTPDTSIHPLLARQIDGLNTSQLPQQCQSSCQPLSDSVASCTTLDCICSEKNSELITRCMSCAVGLSGSSVSVSAGQATIDQFREACKAGGIDLKPQTVTKGDQKQNGASSQAPAVIGAAAMAASALFLVLN